MAKVNMSYNGQTRETSQIVLKGADGSSKTATLTPVFDMQSKALGTVNANETYTITPDSGKDGLSQVTFTTPANGATGITPTGKKEITDTNETDVTAFAFAQVVDSNLKAENIKEGVSILGILGSLASGSQGGDGITLNPLTKIIELDGTASEFDVSDLMDNMPIVGIRIDEHTVRADTTLTDYSAIGVFIRKNTSGVGYVSLMSLKENGMTFRNDNESFYCKYSDDGHMELGSYGKKAMKGKFLFVAGCAFT